MTVNEKNVSDTVDVSWLLAQIGAALKEADVVAKQVARGTGGREISLCITKLEEARHRAVDAMMLLQPLSKVGRDGSQQL